MSIERYDYKALFFEIFSAKEIARRMKASLESDTLPDGTKVLATRCSECGSQNILLSNFCWVCGSPLTDEAVDILAKRLEEVLKSDA